MTMFLYKCLFCGKNWRQEKPFAPESCVFCQSINTRMWGKVKQGKVYFWTEWPSELFPNASGRITTQPKWLFRILHPILYRKAFGMTQSRSSTSTPETPAATSYERVQRAIRGCTFTHDEAQQLHFLIRCATARAVPCKHENTHHEGSLGEFCDDCGAPV